MLVKDGTVIRKWSHNRLPVIETAHFSVPLEKFEIGKMLQDSVPQKILTILVWFALPLFLLTLADRTWAWTQWLRRKPTAKEDANKIIKDTPTEN
jgi:triosephosphate isomerase